MPKETATPGPSASTSMRLVTACPPGPVGAVGHDLECVPMKNREREPAEAAATEHREEQDSPSKEEQDSPSKVAKGARSSEGEDFSDIPGFTLDQDMPCPEADVPPHLLAFSYQHYPLAYTEGPHYCVWSGPELGLPLGPYTMRTIVALYKHGRLTDDSWLRRWWNDCRIEDEQWQRLGAIQAVCTAIARAQGGCDAPRDRQASH